MLECKACGCKFNPVKQSHYIVRDNERKSSLANVFSADAESTLYDAFNCIQCGCQIVVQQRKRAYITGIGEKQFDLKSNLEDESKGETSKFRDKVKITYGPEKREADDVTLDYLQKMSDDELLAFCGENDIGIPEEYRNRGYLISIIKKHCLFRQNGRTAKWNIN